MRLCMDQAHVQGRVEQVQATHQYPNMKTKRKVRKLFYDNNMSFPIDFKNQIKGEPFYIFVLFPTVAFIKHQLFYLKNKVMM